MKNKELKINQEVYFLDIISNHIECGWGDLRIRNGKVVEICLNHGIVHYKVDTRDLTPFTQGNVGLYLFLNKKDAIKAAIKRLKSIGNNHKEIAKKTKEDIIKIKTDPSCLFE